MNDKQCSQCGEIKTAEHFYKTMSRGHTYLTGACRPCHNASSKRTHDRRYSYDVDYKVGRLLHSVRTRCSEKGLPFDLTEDWVLEKFRRGVCEASGLPLNLFDSAGVGERPWGPSLDRIDPSRGYTTDNVQLVCWIYNRAKGAGSHTDVLKMAKAIIANDK